ncbi:Aste57867_7230 [Aphanomyces stellatus]|uniref:Aste57867_7230 protein n=1 Tax=Aphanomyces stellatus TaxID=120398 RepID=A0A485KI18_9STRA|nr:hypothetical protein As57867_007205 [Aphanomyces stellatus]VFT84155.1 Aste57867_7230 [Aphanomyces stellatus]
MLFNPPANNALDFDDDDEEAPQPPTETGLTPAELCHALLKHEGGWVYVKTAESRDVRNLPTRFSVMHMTDDFVECDAPGAFKRRRNRNKYDKVPSTLFDNFTTLRYRFRSLSLFSTAVPHSIKAIIEDPATTLFRGATTSHHSADLPPPPPAHVSKLNASQHGILLNLATPVDYVHGPPGTPAIHSQMVPHEHDL